MKRANLRHAPHDAVMARLMLGTSMVCYIDVPTEAEVQAASAHEAGKAEAAAEHAADDAEEAALAAAASAQDAAAIAADVREDMGLTLQAVGEALAGIHTRLDDMDARINAVGSVAVEAAVIAEEAADVAEDAAEVVEEVVEEEPPEAEEPPTPDTGLIPAEAEDVRRETPQQRKKRYRRI